MGTTVYARRLADTATAQFDKYHLMREQEPPLAAQIAQYWSGIDAFPGVDVPWSAVFVSWCVQRAGATAAEFTFSAAHARFVHAAIRNAQNDTGVFRGRDVAAYAPQLGDILHNNRSGNHYDFAFASTHKSYESHSAIVMETGVDPKGRYLRTVGGNESDSVGMKEVRLDANGLVKNPDGLYISVIQTLK